MLFSFIHLDRKIVEFIFSSVTLNFPKESQRKRIISILKWFNKLMLTQSTDKNRSWFYEIPIKSIVFFIDISNHHAKFYFLFKYFRFNLKKNYINYIILFHFLFDFIDLIYLIRILNLIFLENIHIWNYFDRIIKITNIYFIIWNNCLDIFNLE